MEKELEDSRCSDPRADIETPLESDSIKQCMEGKDPVADADSIEACISAEQRWRERREDEEAAEAAAEVAHPGFKDCKDIGEHERTLCTLAEDYLNSEGVMSPEEPQNWRTGSSWGSKILTKIFVGPFKLFKNLFKGTIQGGATGIQGATRVHESELRKYCGILPGHDECVTLREMARGAQMENEPLGQRTGLGDFTFTRDRAWVDTIDLNYCPLDDIAQRQTFEVQMTPATTGEVTLAD